MTKKEMLDAIRKFHADTSRPLQDTADGLGEAAELAADLANAVEDGIEAS